MSHRIASDLVANVIGISVEVGQRIEPGTEVALLESMKMEIPVLAEDPGTVTEVKVHVGDVVQEGDVLVILE